MQEFKWILLTNTAPCYFGTRQVFILVYVGHLKRERALAGVVWVLACKLKCPSVLFPVRAHA